MIDDDIRALVARDEGSDLRSLEANIWRRERSLLMRQRATRQVAAWQGVVMAFAIAGSASAGFALTRHADPHQARLGIPGEQLAPSTLLFGAHR